MLPLHTWLSRHAQHQLTHCNVQALPPTSGRLLGFMWTSCANAQFVIVTTLGLKCFTLGRQALHSGKSCKALEEYANADLGDVVWYKYQHHTRILIMATQYDLSVLQITGQVPYLASLFTLSPTLPHVPASMHTFRHSCPCCDLLLGCVCVAGHHKVEAFQSVKDLWQCCSSRCCGTSLLNTSAHSGRCAWRQWHTHLHMCRECFQASSARSEPFSCGSHICW